MNRQIAYRATTLAVPVLFTLTACGGLPAGSGPGSTPAGALTSTSCETQAPTVIDNHTGANKRHPVVVLVLNRKGVANVPLRSAAQAVLAASSERGATVLLEGAGLESEPPQVLAGDGSNPSARHADRCARLRTAQAAVTQALVVLPGITSV